MKVKPISERLNTALGAIRMLEALIIDNPDGMRVCDKALDVLHAAGDMIAEVSEDLSCTGNIYKDETETEEC